MLFISISLAEMKSDWVTKHQFGRPVISFGYWVPFLFFLIQNQPSSKHLWPKGIPVCKTVLFDDTTFIWTCWFCWDLGLFWTHHFLQLLDILKGNWGPIHSKEKGRMIVHQTKSNRVMQHTFGRPAISSVCLAA